MIRDQYYYGKLNAQDKRIYTALYYAILSYQNNCVVESTNIQLINRVLEIIVLDNPSLFYLGGEYSTEFIDGDKTRIKLYYNYPLNKVHEYNCKIRAILDTIKTNLSTYKDEYSIERYVHDYLIRHIKYDKTELNADTHNIIGALINNGCVCDGIAKATKLMLNSQNIKCIIVNGNSVKPCHYVNGHAWNIVKIEGQPYHLDVTWDLAGTKGAIINNDYFNLSDKNILRDHMFDFDVPTCNSNKHSYFCVEKTLFNKKNDIRSDMLRHLSNGNTSFYFCWNGKEAIHGVVKELSEVGLKILGKGIFPWRANCSINEEQSTAMLFWAPVI